MTNSRFVVTRIHRNKHQTVGRLFVYRDDKMVFECHTLENTQKVFPAGKYPIKYEYSPRFKMELWELYGINGRSEIKIHPANRAVELEGCIAVGTSFAGKPEAEQFILLKSRDALKELHKWFSDVEQTTITVIDL